MSKKYPYRDLAPRNPIRAFSDKHDLSTAAREDLCEMVVDLVTRAMTEAMEEGEGILGLDELELEDDEDEEILH